MPSRPVTMSRSPRFVDSARAAMAVWSSSQVGSISEADVAVLDGLIEGDPLPEVTLRLQTDIAGLDPHGAVAVRARGHAVRLDNLRKLGVGLSGVLPPKRLQPRHRAMSDEITDRIGG